MQDRKYSLRAVLAVSVGAAVFAAVAVNIFNWPPVPGRPALVDIPNPGLHAEFGRSAALLLGGRTLVNQNRGVFSEIVAAIGDRMPIVIIVDDDVMRRGVLDYLIGVDVRTDKLVFVEAPIRSVWVRDFGPVFVHGQDGRVQVIDPIYESVPDDGIPRYVAGIFQLPVVDLHLKLEGGNVLSNGRRTVALGYSVIEKNLTASNSVDDIRLEFQRRIPAEQYVILEPLVGEPTKHIDMFVTFIAADHVVLARISPLVDPVNAKLLDEHAATFAKHKVDNQPLRVSRVPMGKHTDGVWRSYNNVIFANGVLLVPQYRDDLQVDAEALAVYARLLPEWEVVGINASGLIGKAGSLHCISVNVPWGVSIPERTRSR